MSKHTKARKPLLKLNLRKPCLQPEKGFSFEVFFLLQRDQVWESFPRQSGRLPKRKRQTVLFLLPVKELNTVRMRTMYYLSWSQEIRSSFFLWNNKICRPEQRVICDQQWKYLDVAKTETIYLVALNTLNASLDHDAGLEVSRYRNLKKISTSRLRYIVCVLWVMMQVFN